MQGKLKCMQSPCTGQAPLHTLENVIQECLNFLLRHRTSLYERPSCPSIANRNSHRTNKLEDVVRQALYTRCKVHSCTVVYTSTRCLAHSVTHCVHCLQRLVLHNIATSNVGHPPPPFESNVRCTAHGPSFARETTVHAITIKHIVRSR